MGKTPFKFVYGQEVVMLMENIVPILCIAAGIGMGYEEVLEEKLTQLVQLEEDRFIVGFHHKVEKDPTNAWHD